MRTTALASPHPRTQPIEQPVARCRGSNDLAKCGDTLGHRLKPIGGHLLERPADHVGEHAAPGGLQRIERHRVVEDRIEGVSVGATAERRSSGRHLEEQRPERKNVRPRVDRIAAYLLGGHVRDRAEHNTRRGRELDRARQRVVGRLDTRCQHLRDPANLVSSDPAEAARIGIEAGHLPPDIDQEVAVRTLEGYVWTNTGRIEQYFEMLIDAGRIEADATPRELVERVSRGSE